MQDAGIQRESSAGNVNRIVYRVTLLQSSPQMSGWTVHVQKFERHGIKRDFIP